MSELVAAGSGAGEARRTLAVRFLAVHTLAYAVAFPWAAAAIPAVFVWREDELLGLADERSAVGVVLRWAIGPALVAFTVPHLLGVPWIRAARDGSRRGLVLFAAGSALVTACGLLAAVAGWAHVLAR